MSDVTPSCGCVFCDLDLECERPGLHWVPRSHGKTAEHALGGLWIECKRPAYTAPEADPA